MKRTLFACLASLSLLVAVQPAGAYTAVALSQSLAFGYCNNQQSVGAATDCAMSYCRQAATDPDTCTIGLSSEPTGNYALAIGGGSWGAASADNQAQADRDALGYCQSPACEIVARWTEGIVRGQ